MLKIGVTGGIGSGKSTVCRIFETFGIPVFYADTVAKHVMVSDPMLIEGIRSAFGVESYDALGKLNNNYIAEIVFNNKAELERLNALVHPATFRAFDAWLASVPVTSPYILKEAALLFESGSYKSCDKNILVTTPVELRIERVMGRDQVKREQVMARIDKQLGDDVKAGMSDFIIKNDETTSLILQVLHLHHQFLK